MIRRMVLFGSLLTTDPTWRRIAILALTALLVLIAVLAPTGTVFAQHASSGG